ncbi:hypothetical protein FACS189418_1300 [Clostridia bacterium]|nr:hypothetical protein FACS189418_1300 [Clostridia bacterium]
MKRKLALIVFILCTIFLFTYPTLLLKDGIDEFTIVHVVPICTALLSINLFCVFSIFLGKNKE